MSMKLRRWIERSDYKNVVDFARAANVSAYVVYSALKGQRIAGSTAEKINKATNGKVRVADLVLGRAA